jgi:hypothetical protein
MRSIANVTPASGRRLPAFRSSCAIRGHNLHELRKAKGNRIFMIPVPLTILKFLKGLAANYGGTSKSASLLPHDFAVRLSVRSSFARQASTAAPTFVTIAKRPSQQARDGRASKADLPDGENLLRAGWTAQ